jgi:hypothetical protein
MNFVGCKFAVSKTDQLDCIVAYCREFMILEVEIFWL